MACGIIVRLPATNSFGTDEDFDLRNLLESELSAALATRPVAECGRGEIEDGCISVRLEAVQDRAAAFQLVKDVLSRHEQLERATVVMLTRSNSDPDDIYSQTLWPASPAPAHVA